MSEWQAKDRPREGRLATRVAASCAIASAFAFAAAAPPLSFWPLAGVCLAPLILLLEGRNARARFAWGAGTGVLTALVTVVEPLGSAFAAFFDMNAVLARLGAFVVSGVFAGAGFGVFGWLAGSAGPRSAASVLRIAAAWVAGDLLRTHLLTGLPWLLLGHLLAPMPALCQLASVGGTALVSFWLAAVNACVAGVLAAPRMRASWLRAGVTIVLGVTSSYALLPPTDPPRPGSVTSASENTTTPARDTSVRVALVQPALPQRMRLVGPDLAQGIERLHALSASAGPVDLLVWPENAVPLLLPANADRVVLPVLQSAVAPRALLLGAPHFDPKRGGPFNSALLYLRGGAGRSPVGAHDKVHRVPFTEYTPWPLPERMTPEHNARLEAGAAPRVLAFDALRIGPLICYELLFSDIAREQVRNGANLLVNLSHDGYFGGRAGVEQHLTAAVLRAIELRRPLLRATSDGLTAAIDSGGRIRAALPAGKSGVLQIDVVPAAERSLFARGGHAFGWLAAALAALATLRDWRPGQDSNLRPAASSVR